MSLVLWLLVGFINGGHQQEIRGRTERQDRKFLTPSSEAQLASGLLEVTVGVGRPNSGELVLGSRATQPSSGNNFLL